MAATTHDREPQNLDRLMGALAELEASYLLAGEGHNLMMSKCGPIDLLGTIGKGLTYQDLAHETHQLRLGQFLVSVLDLAALIRVKEETGRDKDRAVLAILKRTLQERMK